MNKKGMGVNDYKLSFGAKTGYDFRIYSPKSILGKAFIFLLDIYFRKKRNLECIYQRCNR